MDFFNERGEIEKTLHKLPHWQQGRVPVFVTFRLADSLPQELLAPLLAKRAAFLMQHPKPWDEVTEDEFHRQVSIKLETCLDAGHGCCALRDPRSATILAELLRYFQGQRYDLHGYVVMPNHVHVLFTPHDAHALPQILQAWKGVSSRMIHKACFSSLNPFWQPDYFDRLIRSPEHFAKVRDYIAENPARAHLPSGHYLFWAAGKPEQ